MRFLIDRSAESGWSNTYTMPTPQCSNGNDDR